MNHYIQILKYFINDLLGDIQLNSKIKGQIVQLAYFISLHPLLDQKNLASNNLRQQEWQDEWLLQTIS